MAPTVESGRLGQLDETKISMEHMVVLIGTHGDSRCVSKGVELSRV